MDLAGNQSSPANLSSSKFHQAGNYVIFCAQISRETLVEVQHPLSSGALPESPRLFWGAGALQDPLPEEAWLLGVGWRPRQSLSP